MTKVEEVARAIAAVEADRWAWKTYRPHARAAIKAMERPTAEMLIAGNETVNIGWECGGMDDDTAVNTWLAMNAAALAQHA